MGDSALQPNAQSLRNLLVGLSRFEQFPVAIQWAKENHCVVDMFGSFAKERHLLLFQSGNESENWIDPTSNHSACIPPIPIRKLPHKGGFYIRLQV